MSNPVSARSVEVFFSYSHKDEHLRDQLETHLALLKRLQVIVGWHDRQIGAGQEWAAQIDAHMNTADIILLLISADFLASDYCFGVEVTRAMERHKAQEACVVPVILRDCDWQPAPFGKLQALPVDARPITSWSNRDRAFAIVARGIRAVVEESTRQQPRAAHAFAMSGRTNARSPLLRHIAVQYLPVEGALDARLLEDFVTALKQQVDKEPLALKLVEANSNALILEGSEEACAQLRALSESEKLVQPQGLKVQEVHLLPPEESAEIYRGLGTAR